MRIDRIGVVHRAVWVTPNVSSSLVGRPAAFFDLDKTIIATSSTLAFGRPLLHNGLINRRIVLKAAYAQLVYLIAGADATQMDRMRDYLAALCTGWDVQQVRDIVQEALYEIVRPLVYAEAKALIDQHRRSGHDVIIVSSSGEEVVRPIGEMLGVDRVIATRMVVEHGRYTGAVAFYAYGENKAHAIRELAAEHGYDLARSYAYSDSVTDLPLLEAVGHPTAVNPDRALRRIATVRGWDTVTFQRPVSLRTRFAGLAVPPMATAAVCAGTLGIGFTWYVVRRRAARPVSTRSADVARGGSDTRAGITGPNAHGRAEAVQTARAHPSPA